MPMITFPTQPGSMKARADLESATSTHVTSYPRVGLLQGRREALEGGSRETWERRVGLSVSALLMGTAAALTFLTVHVASLPDTQRGSLMMLQRRSAAGVSAFPSQE